jgi:hypothetical protein
MSLIIKKNPVANYFYRTPDREMYIFTNRQESKMTALLLAG